MNNAAFVWSMEIADEIDPLDVQAALSERFGDRVSVQQTTRELLDRDEAARRLTTHGPTKVLNMAGVLHEAVLRKGEAPSTLAARVNGMLRSRRPTPSELVIIDPYFFAPSKGTPLPDLVDALWAGVIESATSITVVAKPKADPAIVAAVAAKADARRKGIQFVHRPSEAFHDRFWILDRLEGVLVGTSVGGLGNKYAVADHLERADVAEIVAALNTLGLVTGAGAVPAPPRDPDPQHVALAAYARWLARGCGDGKDLEDWSQAVKFLLPD